MTRLEINGTMREVGASADTPLLWILRDELALTGTKYGCGKALCGACTVLVDGQPIRACVTQAAAVAGKSIVTIEGADDRHTRAVREAWLELNVAQCGYCQSGQILAASALLAAIPRPSDDQISAAMDGNVCHCATYVRIRQAIKRAAERLA